MLEEDQDPDKMSVIQELIGVRCSPMFASFQLIL